MSEKEVVVSDIRNCGSISLLCSSPRLTDGLGVLRDLSDYLSKGVNPSEREYVFADCLEKGLEGE
jgi:hypothetical protein